MLKRYRLQVEGIVQGVGFRPFVFVLAESLSLSGWVFNHSAGVSIEVEGDSQSCEAFLQRLTSEKPALARIDRIKTEEIPPEGSQIFEIRESQQGEKNTLLSPDMGICPDCLADLRNPADRRYRYAFTNCTNCGPRFTIIENLPYDRPMTTMRHFPMCPDCAREYREPRDRRFHAQPIACPDCGPQLVFLDQKGQPREGDPLSLAQSSLQAGMILAVKGLGGYHLVCDAKNEEAVSRLRQRKYRWDKPFAVMMENLSVAASYCELSREEEALLSSSRCPIVLLKKKEKASELAASLAPGNARLGVMLPYTPLHYLLMEGMEVLLMTSANISDEPIVFEDEEAISRLSCIADAFLSHNRQIFRRCDDSVSVFAAGAPRLIRRARGYAPEPLKIWDCGCSVLACGGEQKNTFCLTRGEQAFLSQHIGDMHNLATLDSFTREIYYFRQMFNVEPQVLAYDLHPDYLASRYALEQRGDFIKIPVQHHHAHLASVLAEHNYDGKAIGLIFDGTGYGTDGRLWGGELLLGDCRSFQRFAHLLEMPLPGGELAIREPWRVALGLAAQVLREEEREKLLPACCKQPGWATALFAVERRLNTPFSTGMGRLFDAVAALAGIGCHVNYEGQAAVELEQVLDDAEDGAYTFDLLEQEDGSLLIDWRPLIRAELLDLFSGQSAGRVSARFHRALVDLSGRLCELVRERTGLDVVALSGGCWQNIQLLERTIALLKEKGFRVLLNEQVPCNDGGISYGQAAVAAARILGGDFHVPGCAGKSREN
ncbi:MAG: carbamoyltransferase HypF [Firmicutes bacterium]|nr:carbamoyltransferase HypF [Bacillota bacterium]